MKRLYRHAPKGDGSWALTFDDGPHPEITPRLLDVLDTHGAKATFFLLGESAERQPHLVDEIAVRGHFIASHGYTHSRGLWRGPRALGHEIEAAESALRGLLSTPKFLRPPYGHLGPGWWLAARRHDYRVMLWDLGSKDFLTEDTAQITDRVVKRLSPGRIALFHECRAGSDEGYRHTVVAVDSVLTAAARLGLRTTTPNEWET